MAFSPVCLVTAALFFHSIERAYTIDPGFQTGHLALVMASVGLYGVMVYSVNRRRREIGVRMTLGAQRGAVLQLVISDGMKLVGCGIVLGLGASLVLGRTLSHMLFGISSADPASLASTGVTLFAVALAACYVPARSATRIDPMNALREN